MFTASRLQAATYLFGVCLFSISFLVFLNSSVSFVVTDLLKARDGVGDAVGTLGFADELVALAACPAWGMLSDRLGVRIVCALGYAIVGLALILSVQAKNVYPQLLLARLFFSVGGAATSTMVTAILPSMTAQGASPLTATTNPVLGHAVSPSVTSELTITPARFRSCSPQAQAAIPQSKGVASRSSPARLAGFVGVFTGCGALLALGVFLPLPTRFQKAGIPPGQAIADSYYVVGAFALVVSLSCYIGLRHLKGEESKGWKAIYKGSGIRDDMTQHDTPALPYWRLFLDSVTLGFENGDVGLAYLGGFVARASSVSISLFIPLYVNTYFVSSGLCKGDPANGTEEMKRQCRRAYVLAAELTGVSQLIALLCAPAFGYLSDHYRRFNLPLLVAALIGVGGYVAFALLESPEPSGEHGNPAVFFIVALLGISQIGAIVCSLGLLGRGVLGDESTNGPKIFQNGQQVSVEHEENGHASDNQASRLARMVAPPLRDSYPTSRNITDETTGLLEPIPHSEHKSLKHLKGSTAGIYSLAGGAGILLLTKLGGFLFDNLSSGAPFYMLAIFNGVLLFVGIGYSVLGEIRARYDAR
ncbi:MAG: hypothetical protein M1830_000925 [Pleopsidium flavum]|nr:MAG: hypothetical protein M1830_000925 [Pleopsidium flavum]